MSGGLAETNNNGYISTPDIYLPFFDQGWWGVMVQRNSSSNTNTNDYQYTLYAANKIYDENEGYKIGYIASSSFTVSGSLGTSASINTSWISSRYDGTMGAHLGKAYRDWETDRKSVV